MVNLEAGYCLTGGKVHDMLEYPVEGAAARGKFLREPGDVDGLVQMLHGVGKGKVYKGSVFCRAFVVNDQDIIERFVQDIGDDAFNHMTEQEVVACIFLVDRLTKLSKVDANLPVPIFAEGVFPSEKCMFFEDVIYRKRQDIEVDVDVAEGIGNGLGKTIDFERQEQKKTSGFERDVAAFILKPCAAAEYIDDQEVLDDKITAGRTEPAFFRAMSQQLDLHMLDKVDQSIVW